MTLSGANRRHASSLAKSVRTSALLIVVPTSSRRSTRHETSRRCPGLDDSNRAKDIIDGVHDTELPARR